MVQPPYWQLVKEAVTKANGKCSYKSIVDHIKSKYDDATEATIRAHIVAFSVNTPSRVHWSKNKTPRHASDPRYDFLYSLGHGSGEVMLYDPKLHGQWAIVDKGGILTVSQESVADAGVEGFASLKRIVMKSQYEDVLRKVVRVDPNTFAALRGSKRSRHLIVTIKGKRTTVAKCELADDFKGPGILIDKVTRQNAGTQIAETVDIAAVKVADASRVTLVYETKLPLGIGLASKLVGEILNKQPVAVGDKILVPYERSRIELRVAEVSPKHDSGMIVKSTKVVLVSKKEIDQMQKDMVICLFCVAENPAGSIFCSHCGKKLLLVCSNCGHANRLASKSCAKCKSIMSQSPRH